MLDMAQKKSVDAEQLWSEQTLSLELLLEELL